LPQFMVRGFAGAVKPAGPGWERICTAEDTLLLRDLWFPNVRQEAGVCCAALGIVHSRRIEAQFPIYGVPDIRRVDVLLPIVFPPADRTEAQGVWRLQSPASAARASKTNRCRTHDWIDEFCDPPVTCFVRAPNLRRLWSVFTAGGQGHDL
jgi:hypothetical protein